MDTDVIWTRAMWQRICIDNLSHVTVKRLHSSGLNRVEFAFFAEELRRPSAVDIRQLFSRSFVCSLIRDRDGILFQSMRWWSELTYWQRVFITVPSVCSYFDQNFCPFWPLLKNVTKCLVSVSSTNPMEGQSFLSLLSFYPPNLGYFLASTEELVSRRHLAHV